MQLFRHTHTHAQGGDTHTRKMMRIEEWRAESSAVDCTYL